MGASQLEAMSEFEFYELAMGMAKQFVLDHGGNTFIGRSLFHPFMKPKACSVFEMWEQRYPVWRDNIDGSLWMSEFVGLWEYDRSVEHHSAYCPTSPHKFDITIQPINLIGHDPIDLIFYLDNFPYGLFPFPYQNRKHFTLFFLGQIPGITIRMLYPSEWTTISQYKNFCGYGYWSGPEPYNIEEGPMIHRTRKSPMPTEPYEPLSNYDQCRLKQNAYRNWDSFLP